LWLTQPRIVPHLQRLVHQHLRQVVVITFTHSLHLEQLLFKEQTMSHFAKVENGIVVNVIVAEQDVIDSGIFGHGWVQTSYNTHGGQHPEGRPLRKNYAGVGYTYDATRDAFIPPQPYPSWTMSEDTCLWSALVAMPTEGGPFSWNESTLSWDAYEAV
jgi:hypothetical protein